MTESVSGTDGYSAGREICSCSPSPRSMLKSGSLEVNARRTSRVPSSALENRKIHGSWMDQSETGGRVQSWGKAQNKNANMQEIHREKLNYRDTEKLDAKRRLICLSSSSTIWSPDDEVAMFGNANGFDER